MGSLSTVHLALVLSYKAVLLCVLSGITRGTIDGGTVAQQGGDGIRCHQVLVRDEDVWQGYYEQALWQDGACREGREYIHYRAVAKLQSSRAARKG